MGGREKNPGSFREVRGSRRVSWAVLILGWVFLSQPVCWAKPTTAGQAETVVRNWLRLDPQPLGAPLGGPGKEVRTVCDKEGRDLFHVVSLHPTGFVIIAGDDLVEPVIAFVARGRYDPSETNPLTAIVTEDMTRRLDLVRTIPVEAAKEESGGAARGWMEASLEKWVFLQRARGGERPEVSSGLEKVSDLRVAPFVSSKWGQGEEGSEYCYNYYTPKHYFCGCTAAAMAQLLRYHRHPSDLVGKKRFRIAVDGKNSYATTRGGDGAGGAYAWARMPLNPGPATGEEERRAIGALTYDAGVTIHTRYAGAGSAAGLPDVREALDSFFQYSNARYGSSPTGPISLKDLCPMINPNLDAKLPVLMSVIRSGGAHVVLSDGYGYNLSTLYHHLNLGWNGSDDAWYHLPNIPTSRYRYSLIADVVYNVFPTGTGEIVSGRVTNAGGEPLKGVRVRAEVNGSLVGSAHTDRYGIYALPGLPSKSSIELRLNKPGYTFRPRTVETGRTDDFRVRTGNLWGVNFSARSQ
ncbi:MAG TPA: C10 family peptidase [Syntrophobacteraceae bacterium]|nr:C10 family peptidase [Syntrophobacteraceae bacterium]